MSEESGECRDDVPTNTPERNNKTNKDELRHKQADAMITHCESLQTEKKMVKMKNVSMVKLTEECDDKYGDCEDEENIAGELKVKVEERLLRLEVIGDTRVQVMEWEFAIRDWVVKDSLKVEEGLLGSEVGGEDRALLVNWEDEEQYS